MDHNELTRLIDSDEGPKLDFKRQPWNLDTNEGKGEFIKDILAMANASGLTGYLILGVGNESSRPLESIENYGLREERLQQIAKDYVEPPIVFTYGETNFHDKTIGFIIIPPSGARPHWAKRQISGSLRDRTFYTRRGSTTDFATLNEVEQMFRERPSATAQSYGGWSVQLLWNRKEHIRLVPCVFLEKWEREQTNVLSTDEIRETIETRTGKQLRPQGAGNLLASFNQKAKSKRLSPLFEPVDNQKWRLPKEYIELFREYRRTYRLQ
jgi:predicted HTH transcriptional regulator